MFNQFLSKDFPCSVNIDSGWNWTPLILNFLCLKAIICLFSSTANTSKHSGSGSFTIHEWYLPTFNGLFKPLNKGSLFIIFISEETPWNTDFKFSNLPPKLQQ